MATFDTFTFHAPMPRYYDYDSMAPISPTNTSCTPTPRRQSSLTVSALAHHFSQHTISSTGTPQRDDDALLPSQSSPLPPPLSVPAPHDGASRSPSPAPFTAYTRMSASALRARRQANIRLLADASHLQELHALVERMVDSREQCRVCISHRGDGSSTSSSSSVHSPSSSTSSVMLAPPRAGGPEADEGYGEMEMVEEPFDGDVNGWDGEDGLVRSLRYRRSGDLAVPATVPCVRREVKVRKQRRKRSGGPK